MSTITNRSESFIREIRQVEIYPATAQTFQNNMNAALPDPAEMLYDFTVIPEEFDRKIPTKTRSGNYFFDISLGFPLLDLSKALRDELFERFNRREFMVVLVSNTEKTLLGNAREPLAVQLLDGIKDDASGNDQFNISITGETLIAPKTVNI